MSQRTSFKFENESIKSYRVKDVVVIKFKSKIYDTMTSLLGSSQIFTLFNHISENNRVKALVIFNEPGCFGEREYHRFMKEINQAQKTEDGFIKEKGINYRTARQREINILNRIIIRIIGLKKITIIGLQGDVVTPFFGASLAFDFRYASSDMFFSLAHKRYGCHPSGGLPYFLPFYLNQNQAFKLLLTQNRIFAEEARKYGLLDSIFDQNNFENLCLEEAHKLTKIDTKCIRHTKQLLNYSQTDLNSLFNEEMALIG